jgi:hypothetical protein
MKADLEWDLGLHLRAFDRASSLCDISRPGRHGCGADVLEPHVKLGGAQGTHCSTSMFDG